MTTKGIYSVAYVKSWAGGTLVIKEGDFKGLGVICPKSDSTILVTTTTIGGVTFVCLIGNNLDSNSKSCSLLKIKYQFRL